MTLDNDIGEEDVTPFDDEPKPHWPDQASPSDGTPLPWPLAGLNLELSVRSGTLNLTLAAVQHLAPGSVVNISGVTPGQATLCHGERVVAHGELVEIDGQLGLQITRVVVDQ